jgi:hypothetical protein
VKLAKADPSYLASLTPTQYAMLFPSYYRKQLPDRGLTAATSGATPISTIDRGDETATPLPRFDGTTAKPGPEAPAPKEKPKPSPGLKESWDQKLIREAEARRGRQTSTAKVGNIDRSKFFNELKNTEVRKLFGAMLQAEVGGDTAESHQAFAEKVFNRATIENKSLKQILSNRAYFEPYKNGRFSRAQREIEKNSSLMDRNLSTIDRVAQTGTDLLKGATHNASGSVAEAVRGGKPHPKYGDFNSVKGSIVQVGKETYYYKTFEEEKIRKIPRIKPEEAKRPPGSSVGVKPGDEKTTGAVVPPQDEGTIGPKAEKSKVGKVKFVDRTKEMATVADGRKYGSSEKPEPYKFVGVHYTGGSSLSGALNAAKQKNEGYQYIIDKDGTVHVVQDPNTGRANHWGGSTNENNIHPEAKNANSIGISFVGTGNKDITPAQRAAGLNLFSQVSAEHGIAPENFLGHGEVSSEGHRENTEGYALLEPWRQMNGITPETGKMPNIAPDAKGAMESWKKGNYNYNLESLIPKEGPAAAVEPLKALPEGLDQGIINHYKNLDEEKQKILLDSMTGVPVETINGYYRGDAATATPEAVREKTDAIISKDALESYQFDVPLSGGALQRGHESSLKKMNPELRARLAAVREDIIKAVDAGLLPESARNMTIGSGVRDPDDPRIQELYRQHLRSGSKRPMAHPTRSKHRFGNAADIAGLPKDRESVKVLKEIFRSHGLHDPIPREHFHQKGMPHIEMIPGADRDVKYAPSFFQKIERSLKETAVTPEAPPVESIETRPQPNGIGQPIPQPSSPPGSSIIPDQEKTPPPVSQRSITPTPAAPAAAPTATPTPEPTKSSDLLPDASDPKVQKAMENATPTGEDYRETVKKMQYGGTKQSPTGEPLGAVDMKTGKLMFTHQPGESVNYDKSGQIKVTPNQRRDSQEIESLAQRVKDEVRLDSEAREEAAKTQTSQMAPNPVVNRDWPDTVKSLSQESSNVYKTPSSARAFDQARFSGRKDMFSLGEANLKV